MGSGRGKKQEQAAFNDYKAASAEYKADPIEELNRKRVMKFLEDFDSGKDVKDIEGVRPFFNLFQNAKNSRANQMMGKGVVALGQNPNADSQVSDLDKYVQAQREEEASGLLYDATNQAYADTKDESRFLINTDQSRKANKTGIAANMYSTILHRPKRPPLWERLLGIGTNAAVGAAAVANAGR